MSSKLFIPSEVLETIICLNCNNYLSIFPVYTKIDSSGAICGRCKIAEENKFVRDEAYEGIAQFLVFPCRHTDNGCKEHLTPPRLEDHERCCDFRQFECPSKNYSKCQWKGARIDLVEHFEQMHATLLLKEPTFELNFINSQEEYLLLPYEGEVFIVKKEVDARKGIFSCSVEHLKATEESETYTHALKLESGNKDYFYKCGDKSTCDNERLNSTQLTQDVLRERLNDPASIIVNIHIAKAQNIEHNSSDSGASSSGDSEPKILKKNPLINWDLLSELECPICFEFMLPSIYQCTNGHSICDSCKPKINGICPVCKVGITDTKNFVLEKMTQHLIYPCKFHKSGCNYSCKSIEIRQHENGCQFGPYNCPLKDSESCNWSASHAEVTEHIENNHNDFILKNDKVEVPFVQNQRAEKVYLIKYQKKMFKLVYKFENQKFNWSVQLVGPANESNKYRFEIDIIDLSNSKKRCYFTELVAPLSAQDESFKQGGRFVVAFLEQLGGFTTNVISFRVRVIKE